jgi:malate/lactate dehydrogenase
MKKIAIIGIGSIGVHTIVKNLSNNEIVIIDIKTLIKHGKINNISIPYKEQLLAYKELEPLL